MNGFQNSFAIAALFSIQTTLLAGTWSSGGGEVLEHSRNPWFLLGTTSSRPVTYCIKRASDFALDQKELEKVVSDSISWWQKEYSNAFIPTNEYYWNGKSQTINVELDIYRFVEESCNAKTDLAFQFGYLSKEQVEEFQKLQIDRRRYVALSIRTDYESDLRGKGFIYVSPDRGPFAFKGENVKKDVWDETALGYNHITSALIHELGHVLGIQHLDRESIMSADFLDKLVQNTADSVFYAHYLFRAFFFPKSGWVNGSSCSTTPHYPILREFFGITDDFDCLEVTWNLNEVEVYASTDHGDEIAIGKATFEDGGKRRRHRVISLWLPKGQTAYKNIPPYLKVLQGPQSQEVLQQAKFESALDSINRNIFVQAGPRFFQIGGSKHDILVPDLFFMKGGKSIPSGWEE